MTSAQGDLQIRILEIQRKRLDLEKRIENRRALSPSPSPVNNNDYNIETETLSKSLPTPKSPIRCQSPTISLARAKEEYVKQLSKDYPQWLSLKQQKEAEEIAILQQSVGAVNQSNLVIQTETIKHLEYMKELNEKKNELKRQYEAEAQEDSMRQHQISSLISGKPPLQPQQLQQQTQQPRQSQSPQHQQIQQQIKQQFQLYQQQQLQQQQQQQQQQSPSKPQQYVPKVIDYGFSHRSAEEFLARTTPIADLYLPSFPLRKDSTPNTNNNNSNNNNSNKNNTNSNNNNNYNNNNNSNNNNNFNKSPEIRRPTSSQGIQTDSISSPLSYSSSSSSSPAPLPPSPLPPRGPRSVFSSSRFSDSQSSTHEEYDSLEAPVFLAPPQIPKSILNKNSQEDIIPNNNNNNNNSNNINSSPKGRSRRNSSGNSKAKIISSREVVASHDGKLEMLRKDLQRGKVLMGGDTDAEVEMGSLHDSRDDSRGDSRDDEEEGEEEEEEDDDYRPLSNYMRVASKESINDRYISNTVTPSLTPTESEDETTITTAPTDDTASDDFYISREGNIKQSVIQKGGISEPNKSRDVDLVSDSASEDFFISVNKARASSIMQGNGVISAPRAIPKSNSAIIRVEPTPEEIKRRKAKKDKKERNERPRSRQKDGRRGESQKDIKNTGTDTDEDLEEEFEDFEEFDVFEDFDELKELPEFSDANDMHNVSSPPSRENRETKEVQFRDPVAARARTDSFLEAMTTPRDSDMSSALTTPRDPSSSRATAPTRVLPMGPSSISLMNAKPNSPPASPSIDDLPLSQRLTTAIRSPSSASVSSVPKGSVTFQWNGSSGPDESVNTTAAQPSYMQRQSKQLQISKQAPESPQQPKEKKLEKDKSRAIMNSLSLSQSIGATKQEETLDHGKVLRRLVAYIEHDPKDEFLYRARSDAKLIREIKSTAEKQPRQLIKYHARDCCSALLDTIKTFPGGLLSQDFVAYLIQQGTYDEDTLMLYSSHEASGFWVSLLEHLEVLHIRHLMSWNQMITIFGNTILSGLSNLDLSDKELIIHARHETLRQFLHKDPDSHIEELGEFLGDTDLSVVYALISCQENNTSAPSPTAMSYFTEGFDTYIDSADLRMAMSFITIWLTYNQPINSDGGMPNDISVSRTWPLVMTILSHEFMSMETRVKFFDGVSFGSTLVAAYGRIVGHDYFRKILSSVLGMMARDPASVETDLSRIKGKNPNDEANILNKNRHNLKTACELVMEKVEALKDEFPASLSNLFSHVFTLTQEHVNTEPQVAYNMIRRVFWESWICPFIIHPSFIGIHASENDESVKRALGILAHALRAASLGEPHKVQHISSLTNKFISSFDSLLESFLRPGSFGRQSPPLLDELSREQSLRDILSLLKVHYNKVIKFLQSHDTISEKIQHFLETVLTDRLKSGQRSTTRDRKGSMDLSMDLSSERTGIERSASIMYDHHTSDDEYEENIKL